MSPRSAPPSCQIHPTHKACEGRIRMLLFGLCSLLLSSCHLFTQKKAETAVTDLQAIQARDTLTAVTLNASTSYFIYKMQPMGYEYELIENLADSLGLALEIKVAENITRLEEMLQNGEADIIAYPMQMDNTTKNKYLFCGVEQQNHLVIVQRAGRGDTIARDVTQLIGKEVWVKDGSRHYERLVNLNTELGGGIIIRHIERDTITTEDLIGMVSEGEINYTVSDNRMAQLNRTYYRNIDIRLSIGFPQRTSWVVRNDCPELADAVNRWAANISKGQTLRAATKRYFEQSKDDTFIAEGVVIKKGDISPYDHLFKKYAPEIGWDWQLLASIAYQESKFHNHLVSWAGARGLMGIMPRTARSLGIAPDSLIHPETSIRTGVKCLKLFEKQFIEIEDKEERIKFTLASYNAGSGHIADARNLATKYGKNPNVWDENVADYIRLKSEPAYYNDPVCKHGYLRGNETFKYIKEVTSRYRFYLKAGKP